MSTDPSSHYLCLCSLPTLHVYHVFHLLCLLSYLFIGRLQCAFCLNCVIKSFLPYSPVTSAFLPYSPVTSALLNLIMLFLHHSSATFGKPHLSWCILLLWLYRNLSFPSTHTPIDPHVFLIFYCLPFPLLPDLSEC